MSETLSLDLNPLEQAVLELLDPRAPKSVPDIRRSVPHKTDVAVHSTLIGLVRKGFARTRVHDGIEHYLKT